MELMIKLSEVFTIIIQAFFITVAGCIFVGCKDEMIEDLKRGIKLRKRNGGSRLREYVCPECGYSAWALDHIFETSCHHCGASVKTKPVPIFEKSFVCDEKKIKRGQRFAEK
jgi:ssDNA-binding Zn-finger/Zn-ribbon topoisomerase 1